MSSIDSRYAQLERACPFLRKSELQHKAETVESVSGDEHYFRKKSFPLFDATIYRPNPDVIYSKTCQVLNKKGEYKKVKGFLQIPLDSSKTCELVACTVNKWDKNPTSD